jgi:hypothetical protein
LLVSGQPVYGQPDSGQQSSVGQGTQPDHRFSISTTSGQCISGHRQSPYSSPTRGSRPRSRSPNHIETLNISQLPVKIVRTDVLDRSVFVAIHAIAVVGLAPTHIGLFTSTTTQRFLQTESVVGWVETCRDHRHRFITSVLEVVIGATAQDQD